MREYELANLPYGLAEPTDWWGLNSYEGAIVQCIGQLRTGGQTLGPIGSGVAPSTPWIVLPTEPP